SIILAFPFLDTAFGKNSARSSRVRAQQRWALSQKTALTRSDLFGETLFSPTGGLYLRAFALRRADSGAVFADESALAVRVPPQRLLFGGLRFCRAVIAAR